MTTKKCFKCKKHKPCAEFYRHPQMGDGLLGKCKICTRVDVRLNRAKNRERYNEYDRQRGPGRKKRRDRRKERCRQVTRAAIKAGKIKVRETCENCGAPDRIQIHHPDYDFPLWVRFLCPRCHWDVHSHEGKIG